MILSRLSVLFLCASASLPAFAGGAAGSGDLSKGTLLVANKGDRTLSLVDAATNRQIAAVPEDGVTGHEVAASADGRFAYVPIFGDSGVGKPGTDGQVIRVIDLRKQAITGTIDFGKGVRPHHPVFCEKTGKLYVTTEIENSVSVIDPATLKITGSIPTGQEQSHMLAVSPDGKRGYTANVGPGTVSVLDLENGKLLKVVKVGRMVQRISLSTDGRTAFTCEQFDQKLVAIDTATLEIKASLPLPGNGYGTAPTPDGKTLVVTLIDRNMVGLVDLATLTLTKTIPVPKAPQAVIVRPDGATAYVSCDASAKIAVIDLREQKVSTLISVGQTADGLAWAKGE